MFLTYPQTVLMLAENSASSGDHTTAEQHYNNGVKAAMKQWAMWGASLEVSDADVATYLTANPYDSSKWDEMIGEQFWAASFFDFFESFANWRRTGSPTLTPVNYPGNATGGTIPVRMLYGGGEIGLNPNLDEALSRQGMTTDFVNMMTVPVWWDK